MGLRYLKGMQEAEGRRIEAAAPFSSLEDFVERTSLDEGCLSALAEAGALDGFDLERRNALWAVRGLKRGSRPSLPVPDPERQPSFISLDPLERIAWDLRTTAHSTRGHPLEPLREELRSQGLADSRDVAERPHGSRVRYAGIVICRQQPGTASGVTFLTLEDELGFVNLVVWARVFEAYHILVKTASFLGVTGHIESRDGVVHLIADSFWEPKLSRPPERAASRDFH